MDAAQTNLLRLDLEFLAGVVPVVAVLVQLGRAIPWLSRRPGLLPWASIASGLIVSLAALLAFPRGLAGGPWWGFWMIHGLIAGLTASGLYSAGAKKIVGLLSFSGKTDSSSFKK
jgi:hypothetical protein